MNFFSIAVILRYVELGIDLINLIVYYASDTVFTLTAYSPVEGVDYNTAGNIFGQFVLIGAFVLSLYVLAFTLLQHTDTKFSIFVVVHNAIMAIFFLAAGILILRTWTSYEIYVVADKDTKKACGLTVGSLCIIQCFILIAGGVFTFTEKITTR